MNPNSVHQQVTGQKPFECAVGNTVMNLMGGSGLFITPSTGPATYDFSFSGIDGQVIKGEVKNDDASAKWGNFAIEYMFRGKPSCLNVTSADIWCHYLPRQEVLAVCNVSDLKNYISGCNPISRPMGDYKKAVGYCISIPQLTGQAFIGIIPFNFTE